MEVITGSKKRMLCKTLSMCICLVFLFSQAYGASAPIVQENTVSAINVKEAEGNKTDRLIISRYFRYTASLLYNYASKGIFLDAGKIFNFEFFETNKLQLPAVFQDVIFRSQNRLREDGENPENKNNGSKEGDSLFIYRRKDDNPVVVEPVDNDDDPFDDDLDPPIQPLYGIEPKEPIIEPPEEIDPPIQPLYGIQPEEPIQIEEPDLPIQPMYGIQPEEPIQIEEPDLPIQPLYGIESDEPIKEIIHAPENHLLYGVEPIDPIKIEPPEEIIPLPENYLLYGVEPPLRKDIVDEIEAKKAVFATQNEFINKVTEAGIKIDPNLAQEKQDGNLLPPAQN